MKRTLLFMIATILLIVFAGCQSEQAGVFVSGPADMEPPRFATEQALVEHLRSIDGDLKTDCYYRLNNVPVGMKFDSYSSYFSYVDWWYCDPVISEETQFIYLRWCFEDNGQERLEYDLKENGAGRTKLQVGERTYYYLLVDEPDVGWPKLYDIEWLQDGYLFGINIPEKHIAPNGSFDESLLLKYTELDKVLIDTPSSSQSQQHFENEAVNILKQKIVDSYEGKAEMEYNGEAKVEGIDCYFYSVYVEMAQDDGKQINYAPRLIGLYAIAINRDIIFTSLDGEEWEPWKQTIAENSVNNASPESSSINPSSSTLAKAVEASEQIAQSEASSKVGASHSPESIKRGIYLITDDVPEAATQRAQYMFSSFSSQELKGMGFTDEETATARLAQGIRIGGEDEYADEAYYFFVLCGERVTALVISAPLEDGTYGFQFGKDPLADAINALSTTKQNPAKIVATKNGYYSVDSTNGVQMLQQFIGSSVDGIEADKNDLMARINTITNTGKIVFIG